MIAKAAPDLTRPVRLTPDRAWRTYLGGSLIDKLHGKKSPESHFPEEWLLSAVAARNAGRENVVEGLTRVTGTDLTLAELFRADPVGTLGERHAARYGASPAVLVKLLDAAERLALQVHPDAETAEKFFGSPFGKTECWHILGTRTVDGQEPCVYIGFREGVTPTLWRSCFDRQDIPAMLNCLHRFPVSPGDTILVRGGTPHGIGAGCFLVEIQEPTDFTLRTERVTAGGLSISDEACHQGLGFEKMFEVFRYDGTDRETARARFFVPPRREEGDGFTVTHVVYPEATPLFSLDLITVTKSACFPGNGAFSGLYVLSGEGDFSGEPCGKCDHFLVPACCPGLTVRADTPLTFLRFSGPEA